MIGLLLVLSLGQTPDGGVVVDAPLANPDAVGRALILEQGEITPYRGVLLDAQEDVRRERARVIAETKVADYESSSNLILPKAGFVAIVAGVAAIVAGGVIAIYELKKH